MCDDINTANALTILHQHIKEINALLRDKKTSLATLLNRFFTIQGMLSILGLAVELPILTAEDRRLYEAYLKAKQSQDFARSDEIRKILNARHLYIA